MPPPKWEHVSTTTHHSSSASLRLGHSASGGAVAGPAPSGSVPSCGSTAWPEKSQGGDAHAGSCDWTLAQLVVPACDDHWLAVPAVACTSKRMIGSHQGTVVSSHSVAGSSAVAAVSSQSRPSPLVASTRGLPGLPGVGGVANGSGGVGATAGMSCSRVTTTTRIQPALSPLSRAMAASMAFLTPAKSQSAPLAISSATT